MLPRKPTANPDAGGRLMSGTHDRETDALRHQDLARERGLVFECGGLDLLPVRYRRVVGNSCCVPRVRAYRATFDGFVDAAAARGLRPRPSSLARTDRRFA
jgi:hypothetical protein